MKTLKLVLSAVLLVLVLASTQANARDFGGEHEWRDNAREHGRDNYRGREDDHRNYRSREDREWRREEWHHGYHEGRRGWWRAIGGVWYLSAGPIYAYSNY